MGDSYNRAWIERENRIAEERAATDLRHQQAEEVYRANARIEEQRRYDAMAREVQERAEKAAKERAERAEKEQEKQDKVGRYHRMN
jgi:hypothetical protein